MTLASTIETNDGTVTLTGIVLALPSSGDPTPTELWRAADVAGAPDAANAVLVLSQVLPRDGTNYIDRLPTDGTIWWYRTRLNGNAVGPGPYTDWLNLGTAARIGPNVREQLRDSSTLAGSAAWAQLHARPGTHTQQMLPNAGFEDGQAFWQPITGTFSAINTPASSNGGNWYGQLTSTTGVAAQLVATDDVNRPRYFEVNPGDVLQFGGFLYRESGTANIRYVLELTDKSKASATLYTTANQNTAAWLQVQGQQIVPAGKKYARVWAEIDTTGAATVARVDDAFLRVAFGASTIHNAQGSMLPAPNNLCVSDSTGIKFYWAGATTGHMWMAWNGPNASKTIYRPDGSTLTVPVAMGMPTTVTPTLNQVAGGALGARTLFVRMFYMKDHMLYWDGTAGETSLAVLANNLLKVTAPAAVAGFDGWAVMVGTATGTEFTQPGVLTPLAFGADWTEPVGGATTSGTTPWSANWSPSGSSRFGAIIAVELAASTTFAFYPAWDGTMGCLRMCNATASAAVSSAGDAASAALQNADTRIALTFGAMQCATGAAGGSNAGNAPTSTTNTSTSKYL